MKQSDFWAVISSFLRFFLSLGSRSRWDGLRVGCTRQSASRVHFLAHVRIGTSAWCILSSGRPVGDPACNELPGCPAGSQFWRCEKLHRRGHAPHAQQPRAPCTHGQVKVPTSCLRATGVSSKLPPGTPCQTQALSLSSTPCWRTKEIRCLSCPSFLIAQLSIPFSILPQLFLLPRLVLSPILTIRLLHHTHFVPVQFSLPHPPLPVSCS